LADAQAMLADGCPDVLLTDLGLPDGDGGNLIKQVHAKSSCGGVYSQEWHNGTYRQYRIATA